MHKRRSRRLSKSTSHSTSSSNERSANCVYECRTRTTPSSLSRCICTSHSTLSLTCRSTVASPLSSCCSSTVAVDDTAYQNRCSAQHPYSSCFARCSWHAARNALHTAASTARRLAGTAHVHRRLTVWLPGKLVATSCCSCGAPESSASATTTITSLHTLLSVSTSFADSARCRVRRDIDGMVAQTCLNATPVSTGN